jgi:hypothetical protein
MYVNYARVDTRYNYLFIVKMSVLQGHKDNCCNDLILSHIHCCDLYVSGIIRYVAGWLPLFCCTFILHKYSARLKYSSCIFGSAVDISMSTL